MKTKIPVRQAMVSRVITIDPKKTLVDATKLMRKHDIGSLIITKDNTPKGIITEYDVVRLVAKEKDPATVKVKDVMSSPLKTISPNSDILEAAKEMAKSKIRKLPVQSRDKLIGIITAEDIVRVAPQEIELLVELANMKAESSPPGFAGPSTVTEGNCEMCGNYSKNLEEVEDLYLCPECKESY